MVELSAIDGTRIHADALAAVLGVSRRTVNELAKQGVIKSVGRARYDLAASVQGYVKWVNGGKAVGALASSRQAVAAQQERRIRLANDQVEGRLVRRDVVEAVVDGAALAFRQGLDGLPGRMAAELAGLDDAAAVKARLHQETRRVLADVADRFAGFGGALPADGGAADATATANAGPMGRPVPEAAAGRG